MFYAHSSSDIYYFLIEVKIVISMAGTSNSFYVQHPIVPDYSTHLPYLSRIALALLS